ncbi:MAG: transcriptional regulator, partial [Microthrixaceae bacterium]|nr:transcriptional regulator [Microthrixaceae bacterium]
EISVADIIRAVEGPLADVRGEAPEDLSYEGVAEPLELVWLATRASLRRVLETATLASILSGELGPAISDLLEDPDAASRR